MTRTPIVFAFAGSLLLTLLLSCSGDRPAKPGPHQVKRAKLTPPGYPPPSYPAPGPPKGPTRLLRFPDVHGKLVVFSYAGDLWLVPTAGGTA